MISESGTTSQNDRTAGRRLGLPSPRAAGAGLLLLILTVGCGGKSTPGSPETWDGPRNGAVGEPGWPSGRDGRVRVAVEPEPPWVAGSWIRCAVTVTPEGAGIDPGGGVRLALRRGSDASLLQAMNPKAEGYVTAAAEDRSGRRLRSEVEILDRENYAAPWIRGVCVRLPDGLPKGGRVLLVLGDRSLGAPGFHVQTYTETTPVFRAYSDGDGDGVYGPTREPVRVAVAAAEPVAFRLASPSLVMADEVFSVSVTTEDAYWNPAPMFHGHAEVVVERVCGPEFWSGSPKAGVTPIRDDSAEVVDRWVIAPDAWLEGRAGLDSRKIRTPGLYRLRTSGDLTSVSLPVVVLERAPALRLYWGDLHGHTELSDGAGSIDEYYAFARDHACLDVAAATDHDWLLSEADWEEAVRAAEAANEPGTFVTFTAFEWSEKWLRGGDHNVYSVGGNPELIRCSRSPRPDAAGGENFLAALRNRDVFVIPHVGGRQGRWEVDDPLLKVSCEICSVHGRNEAYGLEGLVLGRRVGFIGSSDGHTGHPGRSHPAPPTFAVESGGFAALWAPELTRESIAEAIRDRRTFATTGERILLDVRAGESLMGSVIESPGPCDLIIRVAGTSSIEQVDIVRDGSDVFTCRPDASALTLRWRDLPPSVGAAFYYVRVRQADGNMAWSSPLWVTGSGR